MSELRRDAEAFIRAKHKKIADVHHPKSKTCLHCQGITLPDFNFDDVAAFAEQQREAGRLDGLREGRRIALLNGHDFNVEFPQLYREFMAAPEYEMNVETLIAKAIEAKIAEGTS